jgi:hypothetical protein
MKYFRNIFDRWKVHVFVFWGAFLLFWSGSLVSVKFVDDILFYILCAASVMLFISTLYQAIIGRRYTAYISFLSIIFSIPLFLFFSFMTFITDVTGSDHFNDNLRIPANIELITPIDWDNKRGKDSIRNMYRTSNDFMIYESFQSGFYSYEIWLGKIDSGYVYLKAFEIINNYSLSEDNLEKQSMVRLGNSTNEIKRVEISGYFTIYEGDWDVYYAARFEVWFRPDYGDERKLMQKNFKISGWQH